MTRANLKLTLVHGQKVELCWNGSATPEGVTATLIALAKYEWEPSLWDVVQLCEQNGCEAGSPDFGSVGNPSYFYEVNQQTGEVKAWDVKMRWQNAPENWKERGWHCYIGDNGRYGFPVWCKGKLLLNRNVKVEKAAAEAAAELERRNAELEELRASAASAGKRKISLTPV